MFAAFPGFPSNTFSVIFNIFSLVIICFNPCTDLFYINIENRNLPELWSIKSGILILALSNRRWFAEGVNFCSSQKSGFLIMMISSQFLIVSAKPSCPGEWLSLERTRKNSSLLYYRPLLSISGYCNGGTAECFKTTACSMANLCFFFWTLA